MVFWGCRVKSSASDYLMDKFVLGVVCDKNLVPGFFGDPATTTNDDDDDDDNLVYCAEVLFVVVVNKKVMHAWYPLPLS